MKTKRVFFNNFSNVFPMFFLMFFLMFFYGTLFHILVFYFLKKKSSELKSFEHL